MEVVTIKTKLDPFERGIEESEPSYRPVSPERKEEIEAILDSARKSRNINIRISEQDLVKLKELSAAEGLPYQTMIASILHKFVTNQLVEERSIRNAMRLLNAKRA